MTDLWFMCFTFYSAFVCSKEQDPKYGNPPVIYTQYHNTLAQQMNIQTAILQSNQLPYSGGIMLLYDLSLGKCPITVELLVKLGQSKDTWYN